MISHWDRRYYGLARHVATWSRDPTTKVGAVVVGADKRDVCFGFNGFPPGLADDWRLHDRDLKNLITRHAEANALDQCSFRPHTIYVTHWPCVRAGCSSAIISRGVRRVVAPLPAGEFLVRWGKDYELSRLLMIEAGIEIDAIDVSDLVEPDPLHDPNATLALR